MFLSHPCTPPHPSQPHTRLLQEHCLFSRQLSPRLYQLNPCGISVKNISQLQRLQSMLARVVTCQWGCISISKTLQELHWLPIEWSIDYKVTTLTYTLLESGEPTYEIPYHEQDFLTCTKIFSRRQATRTMFISYENWITSLSLCRTGNMELPAI